MIQNLFPIPIGIYKLDREITLNELQFIQNQKIRPNMGNKTSVDASILRNKELVEIKKFLEKNVFDYFKTIYNPKTKVNLKITQSWCNYTEPGSFHHKHAHQNSFVSGVFYPQANKETDKIYFYKDGYEAIRFTPNEWNIWNSESWWFPVETGDLILFPSSLTHMVDTVKGEKTRISLSFNTFPSGFLGEEKDLTELNCKVYESISLE